jgi:hypothetical protein
MSLQDDIFDVRAAIAAITVAQWKEAGWSKKSVLTAFDRLMEAWTEEATDLEDAKRYRRAVYELASMILPEKLWTEVQRESFVKRGIS